MGIFYFALYFSDMKKKKPEAPNPLKGMFHLTHDPVYRKRIYTFWYVHRDNRAFFENAIAKTAHSDDTAALLEMVKYYYESDYIEKCGGVTNDGGLPYGSQAVFVFRQDSRVSLAQYIACLSHEFNHVTYSILDRVGVKYCAEDRSHEPYTYYQEFLLNDVLPDIMQG